MTPDQQQQHDLRLALEHAKEVLRVRRWNLLTPEQREELVKSLPPDINDKDMLRAFERVREVGSEMLILVICSVGMGVLWSISFLWR